MATEVAASLVLTHTLGFGEEWAYTAPSGHEFLLSTLRCEVPLDLDAEPLPNDVVKVWGTRPDGRPAAPWCVHWSEVPNDLKDAMLEARRAWARGIWRQWAGASRVVDTASRKD